MFHYQAHSLPDQESINRNNGAIDLTAQNEFVRPSITLCWLDANAHSFFLLSKFNKVKKHHTHQMSMLDDR